MNPIKESIASVTNSNGLKGSLQDAMEDSDVFIGVSVANLLTKELVEVMSRDSIIFALANQCLTKLQWSQVFPGTLSIRMRERKGINYCTLT